MLSLCTSIIKLIPSILVLALWSVSRNQAAPQHLTSSVNKSFSSAPSPLCMPSLLECQQGLQFFLQSVPFLMTSSDS